ncbi:unnamed protein product [Clonostachys chloroleuca]|uniref:Carboxylesterase type B domain-containing protein n=1 Tax=Clonostachys chloroleuca TaxID=1926264 RepID=A0AA35MI15_9HYPO|nr:unnamed protein product [Clonostachys chloroleuca]
MSLNTITIEHELLGTVTGIEAGPHVMQFLGIKYALIRGRFEESLLFEQSQGDATRYGPACPQAANALQVEQDHLIQKAFPLLGDMPVESETECLNLNITIPRDIPTGTKLPDYPDKAYWLSYRTNTFGFLASSELREAGYYGNYGIKDQLNVFVWIKKFIAGFGGDPENVTVMANEAYAKVVDCLGLRDLSPKQRVEKLRTIPHKEIIDKVPENIPNRPVIDDDMAFHRIVALLTDIGFYAPLEIAARGWPNTHGRYLYHFNAPNAFPGPLQGKASHVLDVAYAFQNYNDYLSPSDVCIARGFGLAIVRFANKGQPGWPAWSEDAIKDPGVFGRATDPDTTFGTTGKPQRRPFIPSLLEEYSHNVFWAALQKFLKGE